jgi:hypothetical protein
VIGSGIIKPEEQTGSVLWKLPCAAAVLACAARAVLFAAKEGYAAKGLWGVAARSASNDLVRGLLAALAVAVLLALWRRRSPWRPATQLAAFAGLLAIAYLFIAGLVPFAPAQTAPFDTPRGRAAHAAALLAAAATAALTVFGRRLGPAVGRLAPVAACGLVAAAGAVLLVSGWRSRGGGASAERPNVILISLDAVRADRLGIYGYALPTTPEIDRFFSESAIRFDAAFAPQPFTLTSHLTMLTSLHPAVHGVDNDRGLPPGAPTLAQVLANDGYVTAGQVFNVAWMNEMYGFGRGFHIYQRVLGDIRSRAPSVDALLDDLEDERFFLFLHYYDAHSDFEGKLPYDSDPEDRAAFSGWYHGDFTGCDAGGRCAHHLLRHMRAERRTLPEEDRRYVSSLYDAGLRTLDRGLGGFFRGLGARGLLDRTIVVLTADHGEAFQEHGQFLHYQAYDETMHVPLLVRVPGAGGLRVSSRLASLEDIAPTILDFCGIATPPEMQGRSLRPLVSGGTDPPERSKLLMMDKDDRLAFALRTTTWKILTTKSTTELYDLVRDPAERNDLMAHRPPPPQAEQLRRDLEAEVQQASKLRARLGVPEGGVSLTESQKEQLRALGYIQ